MSDRFDASRLDVRLDAALAGSEARPAEDQGPGVQPVATPPRPAPGTPFQIAVLGDFTGRASRTGAAPRDPGDARPVLVDRDNLEAVLARLGPELHVELEPGARPRVLKFRALDDFHPDHLFAETPALAPFRELRERLADPRTAPAAVREILGDTAGQGGGASAPPPPGPRSGGALLEDILSASGAPAPAGTAAPAPAAPPPEDDLARFIRQATAPSLLPRADARQGELLAQLDATVTDRLRRILHDPGFQALEALWRGVNLLVKRLDTGGELKVFLIDVSGPELAADLLAHAEVEGSGLYRLLVDATVGTPGATPWAVILGCYTFGTNPRNADLLRRLGAVAQAAGAPFIAAAAPALAGWPSFESAPLPEAWTPPDAPAWAQLRTAPEARWLGLVAPRFLLREPYGQRAEPCELLPFEELDPHSPHDRFLWGHPALVAGLLLGETFARDGWSLRPGARAELDGLPLHTLTDADGSHNLPCAETLLTERAAERMMEGGIMPLATMKDSDAVRLVRFQSIAQPLAALAGRWRGASG